MEQQGHKIFISYKYHDKDVFQRVNHRLFEEREIGERTPRDYVNVLETYIKDYSPHYYKAEEDNNDLSRLSDNQIWELLKDKIFDSTLTIILVSPNMKEKNKLDRDQWIPWEIQYSLGLQQRKNSNGGLIRSNTNAMMAIVLPDSSGSYEYYFKYKKCCSSGCRINKTSILFNILKKNTFNLKKDDEVRKCQNKDLIHYGKKHSFIPFYRWDEIDSKEKIENAIRLSYDILSCKDKYNLCYEID